jgi:hypothetical protein
MNASLLLRCVMAVYFPVLEEEPNLEVCANSDRCLCSDSYVVDDR